MPSQFMSLMRVLFWPWAGAGALLQSNTKASGSCCASNAHVAPCEGPACSSSRFVAVCSSVETASSQM